MNIVTQQTSPSGPSSAIPTDPALADGAITLSPDALMAYCQSRLNSIDDQVAESFAAQRRNASETKQIDGIANLLKNYGGTDQKDPAKILDMENQMHDLIVNLQGSDPHCAALPKLTQTYNNMVYSGTGPKSAAHPEYPDYIDEADFPPDTSVSSKGDMILGATELQSYAQNMTDAAAGLNSDSELQMIHLQSLMAQRQTAISLTTNLVQSLNDQESKIVANIGH